MRAFKLSLDRTRTFRICGVALTTAGVLAAALATPSEVAAQAVAYPTKSVRIIVGRTPGGVADIAARVVAQRLTERWKQQVNVDNRPGGSGAIAGSVAAQTPADGYTLLVAADSDLTINKYILKNWQPYYERDLVPVMRITTNPVVIVANANAPFNDVQELVAAAKAKPGAIAFATAGIGSSPHLVGEYFASQLGIQLKHIAYKGGSEAVVAAAGGETQLAVLAVSSAAPQVKAGKLKVIGLSTAARIPGQPDWPTIAERGLPGFEGSIWTALFVRAGTPVAISDKLRAEVTEILKDPAVIAQFDGIGAYAAPLSAEALSEQIKRDSARNSEIVSRLKLTLD